MKKATIPVGLVLVAIMVMASGLLSQSQPAKEEFKIESYTFVWTVAKSDTLEFRIEKTEEKTTVSLHDKMEFLTMTPADAEAVAAVLAKTDEYYDKMKGDAEKDEEVKAGGCVVRFWNSPKYGFSISVASGERYSSSSVMMKRADAKALAPHLAKAKAMAAFVDAKIKP